MHVFENTPAAAAYFTNRLRLNLFPLHHPDDLSRLPRSVLSAEPRVSRRVTPVFVDVSDGVLHTLMRARGKAELFQAFVTCPGFVATPAMAFRVSTMCGAHSASSFRLYFA